MESTKEVINSYNEMHSQTDKLLEMPSFYEWILDKLEVRSGKNLLDVATGTGSLLNSAQARQVNAFGIDISIKAIKKAKPTTCEPKLMLSDGEYLPFENDTFDYATNIGSLEHFINPDRGIREIFRVLRRDGKAAIFLPNSYYLGDILTTVLLQGDNPSHNQVIDRFAAKNEWRKLLEKNGLIVQKIFRYNYLFPRTKSDWNYLKNRPKKILGILISPFIPFNLSYSFLYICKKKI